MQKINFFLSRFRQHPHKLSSKTNVPDNGIYARSFNVRDESPIEFKDIGIVFVKKENIYNSLNKRKQHNNDPTSGMCSEFFLFISIDCNFF